MAQLGQQGVGCCLRGVGVAGAAAPQARSPHCHQSHFPRRSLHQTPPPYHSGQKLAWALSPQKFHLGVSQVGECHWKPGWGPRLNLPGGSQGREGAGGVQTPGLGQRGLSGWLWLEVQDVLEALGLPGAQGLLRAGDPPRAQGQLRAWCLLRAGDPGGERVGP